MPDPIETGTPIAAPPIAAVATEAPAPSPAPAPVAEAPAAAVEPAAAAPAAATETPVAAEAEPVARPSLLAEAKTTETKPEAEAAVKAAEEAPKPEGEAAPVAEEVKPAEPEPIKYGEFKLPEGVVLEADKMGKYTELLGKHRAPPELGQELVDFHVAEMAALDQRISTRNWETWNKMQDGWVNEFRTDRELGGNREATTLANCAAVIEQYGGSPDQQAQLRSELNTTGAGNNPRLIRLLNNVAKVLSEGRPVPAPTPPPKQTSRSERRYNNKAS